MFIKRFTYNIFFHPYKLQFVYLYLEEFIRITMFLVLLLKLAKLKLKLALQRFECHLAFKMYSLYFIN